MEHVVKTINEYFNEKGILRFDTGPELIEILDNLSKQQYHDRLEYVKENFKIAKKHISMDDMFAENLIKTIPELLNE